MKIALVDNMNNNFFSLLRYLHGESVDVHLYLTDSTNESNGNGHFLPENDTYNLDKYKNYIHSFPVAYSWRKLYSKSELNSIHDHFKKYDYVIACGFSMSFLFRAGVKINLFIPYGGDLFILASKLSFKPKEFVRYVLYRRIQRQAIRSATLVLCNKGHALYDKALESLGVSPTSFVFPMIFDEGETETYHEGVSWQFMDEFSFIVFSQTRHVWKSNQGLAESDFNNYGGNKRNDKLINGFADFIRITKSNSLLVLFEYGPDVAFSKKLIKELSIEKYVRWMPKMSRKEIFDGIRRSNVLVDQLREGITGIGGSSLEGLALGKPVLTHTNNAIYDVSNGYYGAPFIDVISKEEICQQLVFLYRNPIEATIIGEKGSEWYNKYSGRSSAIHLLRFLSKRKSL